MQILMHFQEPARFGGKLTDDEGYHGGSIASCLFQAFDEFLYFPYLNVLLGLVGLLGAHCARRRRVSSLRYDMLPGYAIVFGRNLVFYSCL